MLKRKLEVGGYAMSSSDEDNPPSPPPPAVKKTKKAVQSTVPTGLKPSPFNPPNTSSATRTSVQPRLGPPRLGSSTPTTQASGSILKPQQKGPLALVQRTTLPTPRTTPNPPGLSNRHSEPSTILESSDSETDDTTTTQHLPESPVDDMRTKANGRVSGKTIAPLTTGPSLVARRPHALEREVDALSISITECVANGEDRAQEILALQKDVGTLESSHAQLASNYEDLKAKYDQLSSVVAGWQAQPVASTPSTAQAPQANTESSEPILTPDLDFDARVDVRRFVPVSEAPVIKTLIATFRHRKNDQKPQIPDVLQVKKHLRKAAIACLDDVSKFEDIKAPYFDLLGKHTMFPPELTHPTTGDCSAYPDWSASAESQFEFFIRVIHQVRSTAPQNSSELSVHLRTMTEKLMIEFLMDGPWTSCVTQWKKMTDKNPERAEEIPLEKPQM